MSAAGRERGAWFTAAMAGAAGRLPLRLNRVVSARLFGFAVISSVTFTVDLALLTAFRGGLRWPLPLAITAAYALASGLGYLLNRSLNFRSHPGRAEHGHQPCQAVVRHHHGPDAAGPGPGAGPAQRGAVGHLQPVRFQLVEQPPQRSAGQDGPVPAGGGYPRPGHGDDQALLRVAPARLGTGDDEDRLVPGGLVARPEFTQRGAEATRRRGHVVGEPHDPHTLIPASPGSRICNSA
jgi:hypothetical protein